MRTWVYDPHSGGSKISPQLHQEICKQADQYASTCAWYPRIQLKLRFKNQFCYIDTVEDEDNRIFPLCRLRNLKRGWSIALFTYSNEKYEPCSFPDGKFEGTLEAALELCKPFII